MQVLDMGHHGNEQQKCPKPQALGVLPPFLWVPWRGMFSEDRKHSCFRRQQSLLNRFKLLAIQRC